MLKREIDSNCDVVVLEDKTSTGRVRPWSGKKVSSMKLGDVYELIAHQGATEQFMDPEIARSKALRLYDCGTALEFEVDAEGGRRLVRASFCRVRLCPMCAWRRSLKTYSNVRQIVEAVDGKYAYVMLTLTVRNCRGAELSGLIGQMMEAWHRLIKCKEWCAAVKGWYRGLEITHNVKPESESFDTYHPHFHVLLAVNPSYFRDRAYISQKRWVELWQRSMQLDYVPVVDVRKTYGTQAKDLAELAKYTVKDVEYINPEDMEFSAETVRILDRALDRRRLVAFGGVLKELHRKLHLDDEVDGDLVHLDDGEMTDKPADHTEVYLWHTGYRQYVRKF